MDGRDGRRVDLLWGRTISTNGAKDHGKQFLLDKYPNSVQLMMLLTNYRYSQDRD